MSVSTALRLRDRRRKGWKRERKGKSRGNSCSGEGTTYVGLYGEAPLERGIFFRLQVYERVGKSVIWVCESTRKG